MIVVRNIWEINKKGKKTIFHTYFGCVINRVIFIVRRSLFENYTDLKIMYGIFRKWGKDFVVSFRSAKSNHVIPHVLVIEIAINEDAIDS